MPRANISTSYRGDWIGMMAIDPGQTTGLVTATLRLEGSTKDIFANGEWETAQVKCYDGTLPTFLSEQTGAKDLAHIYMDCQAEWVLKNIPFTHHFLVFEDFNLRGQVDSLDRSGISPVRVTSLLQGMLVNRHVNYIAQQPGDAKSRWTNDRLRAAGLWERGMGSRWPHAADAMRHAALAVARLAA